MQVGRAMILGPAGPRMTWASFLRSCLANGICAPPMAEAGAFLQKLRKECRSRGPAINALKNRLLAAGIADDGDASGTLGKTTSSQ